MFKKIFVLIALMLPVSVFADDSYFTNGDNSLYTIKYKVCTKQGFYQQQCDTWAPDVKVVQVGPKSGSVVKYKSGAFASLLSVTDEKNNSLSESALTACSWYTQPGNILVFFHIDEKLACKSGGLTPKK